MKTRKLVICIVLTGLMLAPLALAAPDDGPGGPGRRGPAEGPRRGMGMGMGGFGGRMMGPIANSPEMLLGRLGERLNLTEEQRDSLQTIAEANREAVRTNRQAVQDAMEALNEAVQAGDVEKIKAAGQKAGDALTQQALKQAEIHKKVNGVLTDAQKEQLKEMRDQARERMEQMRQQRRQGMQNGEGPRRRGPGRPNEN